MVVITRLCEPMGYRSNENTPQYKLHQQITEKLSACAAKCRDASDEKPNGRRGEHVGKQTKKN